jgi:hypothetical protein
MLNIPSQFLPVNNLFKQIKPSSLLALFDRVKPFVYFYVDTAEFFTRAYPVAVESYLYGQRFPHEYWNIERCKFGWRIWINFVDDDLLAFLKQQSQRIYLSRLDLAVDLVTETQANANLLLTTVDCSLVVRNLRSTSRTILSDGNGHYGVYWAKRTAGKNVVLYASRKARRDPLHRYCCHIELRLKKGPLTRTGLTVANLPDLDVAGLMRRHLRFVELDKVLMPKVRRAVVAERQDFKHYRQQRLKLSAWGDAYRAETAQRTMNFLTREIRLGRCNAKAFLPKRWNNVFEDVLSFCRTVETTACVGVPVRRVLNTTSLHPNPKNPLLLVHPHITNLRLRQ